MGGTPIGNNAAANLTNKGITNMLSAGTYYLKVDIGVSGLSPVDYTLITTELP